LIESGPVFTGIGAAGRRIFLPVRIADRLLDIEE
jgi:hypothetical protein